MYRNFGQSHELAPDPDDVLAAQHATIRIPYVHAAADATYSDYKTNVAIDDDVFTAARH